VAISGEQPYPGWSRWAAVPGSSPGSPHAVDRGDIATGGGADGEGELVPPPLSPTLQPSYFSPASLARASCRLSIRSLPAPPPRLSRGKGSARSDSCHGPCIAFSPLDRFAPAPPSPGLAARRGHARRRLRSGFSSSLHLKEVREKRGYMNRGFIERSRGV